MAVNMSLGVYRMPNQTSFKVPPHPLALWRQRRIDREELSEAKAYMKQGEPKPSLCVHAESYGSRSGAATFNGATF